MIRVTELRQREVINIIDGRRLGIIKDLDLDLEAGRVKALIVPGQGGRFFSFSAGKRIWSSRGKT